MGPGRGRRPHLVYWNNIPSPYLVDRLNRLTERGNLEVEAWFNDRSEPDRGWRVDESRWGFAHSYLAGADRPPYLPARLCSAPVPDILVSLYSAPAFAMGSTLLRRRGARTALWVLPTFDTWVRRRWWKEQAKRRLFRAADAVLTTGRDGRAFVARYGADPATVHTIPHFADHELFAAGAARFAPERQRTRTGLGLTGVTFAYMGRFWPGKGLDHLLDAYRELAASDEVNLLLVGEGEQEAALRRRCRDERIPGVVFVPFTQRDDLARLYTAADAFVFPTLGDPFGHVLGEAASCGLPLLTTSAAGEVEARVEDGLNGFLVPPGNSAALLERMRWLAGDPDLRTRMGKEAASRVAGQTLDHWCRAFEDALARVLDGRPATMTPAQS
jgi:glycosyltransferase involved in cell wall biosynthesis